MISERNNFQHWILLLNVAPCQFPSARNAIFKYYSKSIDYDSKYEINEKIEAFNSIQKQCLEHGIRLILIFPPEYSGVDDGLRHRIEELSAPSVDIFIYNEMILFIETKITIMMFLTLE